MYSVCAAMVYSLWKSVIIEWININVIRWMIYTGETVQCANWICEPSYCLGSGREYLPERCCAAEWMSMLPLVAHRWWLWSVVRVDILTWPTACFTASKTLGCRQPSTTWLTLKNSFQNSSTCPSFCSTTTTLILVSSLLSAANHDTLSAATLVKPSFVFILFFLAGLFKEILTNFHDALGRDIPWVRSSVICIGIS